MAQRDHPPWFVSSALPETPSQPDPECRPLGPPTYPDGVSAPPNLLSPRLWGAHALMLVCLCAALGLGLWQLGSWQAQREQAARDLTDAAPIALADVIGPDDPFPGAYVGQPVELAGTWVPDGTVFVSGREYDGAAGYWVVTPLAIGDASAPAVPVVRGWVADPAEAPAAPTGEARLVGWLQPTEGTGAVDPDPHDDVLPQLRTADVIQHVDQDLYGAYVVDRGSAPGLERATLEQLPDAGMFTGLRNFLYSLEWWVFAGFAVFIWWRYVRDVTRVEPDGETAAEDDREHAVPSGT